MKNKKKKKSRVDGPVKINNLVVVINNISAKLHTPCYSLTSHNCRRSATIQYTIKGSDNPICCCNTTGCVKRAKAAVENVKKRYAR
jgi:hypothetical protein